MKPVMIDTLEISRKLVKAGAGKKLAEEWAEIMREAVDTHLATKSDLRELELRLRLFIGSGLAITIGVLASLRFFG